MVYVTRKSREIDRAKPELAVERRFSDRQVKVLNYEDIFVYFLLYGSLYEKQRRPSQTSFTMANFRPRNSENSIYGQNIERALFTLTSQRLKQSLLSLLHKKAIVACDHEDGEYISPIFTSPKKDGTHHMILNLKSLNKIITQHHLKMDTIWNTECLT